MGTVSYRWSGPSTGSLTDSANWTPAGVPGSTDVAGFGQAGSNADITVTGTDTVGELGIHGDAVTLSSGTVTTTGLQDTTYNATVGTAIDDGGSLTLGTATSTATLDTGTLYVGSLSGGSLTVDAGSTVHADTIEVGGSLNLAVSSTVTGTIDLDGGTINVAGGGTKSLADAINLEPGGGVPDLVNAGNTELTLTGALSDSTETGTSGDANGPGTLTVEGFVRLSHAQNTYSGGTILDSGANLRVAADGAAGTGAIVLKGTGDTLAVAPGVTLGNSIEGFQQGDRIDMAGLVATSAYWQDGTLTLFNGTTSVVSPVGTIAVASLSLADNPLSLANDYSVLQFNTASDGNGGTVVTVSQPTFTAGETFTLTTGVDTLVGSPGSDLFLAAAGTLSAGDAIDGGPWLNALKLQGGGIFHLNAPTSLDNIQILYAKEGGTSSDQQNVFLRDGTNLTVEVSGSSDNPKAPWLNSITIHGANNSDTIFLGPGYDTVVLGSANEKVVGGSGTVGIVAASSMLGATLSGGSGGGTLMVTGGGTAVMGDAITRMQKVVLSNTIDFTANAESGLTIIGTTTDDTIRAGGANQTIVGYNGSGNANAGPHYVAGGFATLVGSTAGHDTFSDSLGNFGYDTIENFGAPGDIIDVTDVAPTNLSLSYGDGLALSGNGIEASITLPGTFDPNGFHLASDGHGGTDITYTAPTATAATTTASKLTSAMASFSATGGGLDTASPSTSDQHTPLLAASTGHA